jgi:hypothetical protein
VCGGEAVIVILIVTRAALGRARLTVGQRSATAAAGPERLDRGQLILQWHQRVHIVPIAFKRLSISAMVIS